MGAGEEAGSPPEFTPPPCLDTCFPSHSFMEEPPTQLRRGWEVPLIPERGSSAWLEPS